MPRMKSAFGLVFFCLMTLLGPSPSDGQSGRVDRREWKKLEKSGTESRLWALDRIDRDADRALLEDIAKKDRDPVVRAYATKFLTDQALLASLAVQDSEVRVRAAATRKLTDSKLLLQIVTTDPSPEVRVNAAENPNLTDQAALATVAVSDKADPAGYVRRMALKRLTDQALIASVARDSSYQLLRIDAVEKLSDQSLLEQIAQNVSIVLEVRLRAVMKLSDQTLVARFATDEDSGVRLAAVEPLADQALLAKLARTDSSSSVRLKAAAKLTDQAELAIIAVSDEYPSVRKAAVGRLNDKSILVKIAQSDPDEKTAFAAAERIGADASLLKILAINASHAGIRYFAVTRTEDQSLLAEVVRKDPSRWNRESLTAMVKDQSVLAEIGRKDRDWEVRLIAVRKIEDQATLALIAKTDSHATVAELALNRIGHPGPGLLEDIVRNGATFGARMAALDGIADRSMLELFAARGADPWIRALATLKLPQDPSSDIVIQLSKPSPSKPAGDPADSRQGEINLWIGDRATDPVSITGVLKIATATGERALSPNSLRVHITVQNRNPIIGYRNLIIESNFALSRVSDGFNYFWRGDTGFGDAPAGATVDGECEVPGNERHTEEPGLYRAMTGRFVMKEASAYVRVPYMKGARRYEDLDVSVISERSRVRLELGYGDMDYLSLVPSKK